MKVHDKYSEVRKKIKAVFDGSASRYGYRRIHSSLKNEEITVSKKVIRRIMQEDKLVVPNIKRKKYNSYKGEITPAVPNVIERDFSAEQRFAISILQNIIANAILYCDGFYALFTEPHGHIMLMNGGCYGWIISLVLRICSLKGK